MKTGGSIAIAALVACLGIVGCAGGSGQTDSTSEAVGGPKTSDLCPGPLEERESRERLVGEGELTEAEVKKLESLERQHCELAQENRRLDAEISEQEDSLCSLTHEELIAGKTPVEAAKAEGVYEAVCEGRR